MGLVLSRGMHFLAVDPSAVVSILFGKVASRTRDSFKMNLLLSFKFSIINFHWKSK